MADNEVCMTGISLSFGALSRPIKEQLNKQGYTLSESDEKRVQHLAESLVMVKLHGLFCESACNIARKRLMNQIVKALVKIDEVPK